MNIPLSELPEIPSVPFDNTPKLVAPSRYKSLSAAAKEALNQFLSSLDSVTLSDVQDLAPKSDYDRVWVDGNAHIPERHLRPLAPLEPEQQCEVYAEVIKESQATNTPVTGKAFSISISRKWSLACSRLRMSLKCHPLRRSSSKSRNLPCSWGRLFSFFEPFNDRSLREIFELREARRERID
jgi:hypothetical protein